MSKPPVHIASDHRGFALKAELATWLAQNGYSVTDLGPGSADRCDAGDYAVKLAGELKTDPAAMGILICGTGQAMAMTANRYQHLRAALCSEPVTARLTREHNDANVLVLGADVVGPAIAAECIKIFLTTAFLSGRYTARLEKLIAMGGL